MTEKRRKAIIRRNIFLIVIAVIIIAIIGLTVLIISAIKGKEDSNTSSETEPTVSDTSSSDTVSEEPVPEIVTKGNYQLDMNYENLMLVNDKNPLPDDFDYESHLITLDDKYINGSLKQIDRNVEPYMLAMIEAAWADNVKLYVWSPYRSYATQNMLFEKQVARETAKGLDRAAAEKEAATVVARPGTSEHNTGLAADFNMADDKFESTEMFTWMQANAEEYGFVMRYSKEKQPITGVIHESWHWRFVGINAAKEMNRLGMCLEEYVEFRNNNVEIIKD